MNFTEIAQSRQSCRSYDPGRPIEQEKLEAILASARLAPSACNGQPYHLTLCQGEAAKEVAKATMGMGMNKFAANAPALLVISEEPYVKSAALGAKLKKNDYRSMDIGIVAAYITAEAAAQGLGSCILGWLDDEKLRSICGLDAPVRLVITLGYPEDDKLREKKRKSLDELVTYL
ncbi:MAG: nitroreductase family protein [Oscillospiraceae bacterium]|nr:nitroreductase family protein [Oscillospiraceae bacterium]